MLGSRRNSNGKEYAGYILLLQHTFVSSFRFEYKSIMNKKNKEWKSKRQSIRENWNYLT